MRLWTIQTKEAHQRLLETGRLYGDWRRAERDFKSAYKWLCAQMEQRGIRLKGRPPIWAWTHKPDMRIAAHSWRGKNGVVRLEIEVPDDQVLVSNFEAWHCVLNDHYLVTHDSELAGMFDHPQHEVEASWQKIFQLEHINALPGYTDLAQATFPEILLDHVVRSDAYDVR